MGFGDMKDFLQKGMAVLFLGTALTGCGGGGGGAAGAGGDSGGAGTPGDTLPLIGSFGAASPLITSGGSTTLNAIFSGGTGSIDNGIGSVSSGVSVPVNPSITTTYKLTVTNSSGSVTATTTVSVQSAVNPGLPAPIVLAMGGASLPYSGSLSTRSIGYFQITGLTAGHRYAFDITATNYPTIGYYTDAAYTTQIKCDPNVSSTCSIIVPGNSIWIRIFNSSYFYSSSFTINAQDASAPTEFEGAWDAPVILNYVAGATTHVGKVDEYFSYYKIQGLTIGKTYTFWVHSMTDDVRMLTLDPVTHAGIGGYCAPDRTYINGATNPESCTWGATDTSLSLGIDNTSLAAGAAYLLRVEEGVASEGSAVAPVIMTYSAGKAAAAGRVAAGGASYYKVTGLAAGVSYNLSLNAVERPLAASATYSPALLQPYGTDATYTTQITCTSSVAGYSPSQCVYASTGTSLFFKVVGPAQFDGMTYNLSLTPVPVDEGVQLAPLALNYSALPYTGSVASYYSEYTVNGLTPNTFYQVYLKNITGNVGLVTWENTSAVINCMQAKRQTATTCFQNSGPNGVIRVRTDGTNGLSDTQLGSFYTLEVTPGIQLSTTYQDKSGPIAIQDPTAALNPVVPTSVPIVVSGDPVTSISNVTVELFIRHGYTSNLTVELVAPDGVTTVTLIAKNILFGDGFYNLKLNDYATTRVESGVSPYNGTYRPHTPLHVLNGMNANGTWTLRVKDDVWSNITGQTGEYYAWGITFN